MARVPEMAEVQMGTFTRTQAYDDGWSQRQVRRWLKVGVWKVVAGQALADSGLDVGAWQLAFAVRLTWPRAVISHQVAAALHGFPVPLHLTATATVPHEQALRARGLRAYRSPLGPEEVGLVGGQPVTTPLRTAVDLLACLPWADARSLWAWVSTRQVVTLGQLGEAARARHRRRGTPQLDRLLRVSASGSLSAAEDRTHELLRAAGIVGWRANVPVLVGGRVIAVADVLFERHRLVIEVDGYRNHQGRDAFQRDRTRQNALVRAGYVVLRFTWEDLSRRPRSVIDDIRAALSSSGVPHDPS